MQFKTTPGGLRKLRIRITKIYIISALVWGMVIYVRYRITEDPRTLENNIIFGVIFLAILYTGSLRRNTKKYTSTVVSIDDRTITHHEDGDTRTINFVDITKTKKTGYGIVIKYSKSRKVIIPYGMENEEILMSMIGQVIGSGPLTNS